jgi:hypothetical protein
MKHSFFTGLIIAICLILNCSSSYAWPTFCQTNQDIIVLVDFAAAKENSIILEYTEPVAKEINPKTGYVKPITLVTNFNNYFGRGAGPEWIQGSGWWNLLHVPTSHCFRIIGRHKDGGSGARWLDSPYKLMYAGNTIKFEDADAVNGKYNAATVTLLFSSCCPTVRW